MTCYVQACKVYRIRNIEEESWKNFPRQMTSTTRSHVSFARVCIPALGSASTFTFDYEIWKLSYCDGL